MLKQGPTKSPVNYVCESCDYKTRNKKDYTKHLQTIKHNAQNGSYNAHIKSPHHICGCGGIYKHIQSFNRHIKTCIIVNVTENAPNLNDDEPNRVQQAQQIDMSVVIELLKQNQEFKDLMVEQSKQLVDQQHKNQLLLEQQQHQNNTLLEAVKGGKIGNTINNNTTNNKFNLNFFLNETCKDAITMSDFINSIQVTMEEFIQTGNIGFVDGISKVMVDRIKVMDLHTRPMHCTDLKRETLYIKNDDKWEKEDSDKTFLRKAVKNIANKNYNQLTKWYNNSKPEVEMIGSEDCENYFKYYKAALGGYDKEEDKKFEEKIIKNVLKEVLLDKVSC
jgi:hypothetical protein